MEAAEESLFRGSESPMAPINISSSTLGQKPVFDTKLRSQQRHSSNRAGREEIQPNPLKLSNAYENKLP
jgi:hypothetical protein